MKKIFAVNSGSFDGYRVDALFSTRKLAEEFMEAVPDPEYGDIEEYELDPPVADFIKRGYSIWRIHMLVDGITERVEKVDTCLHYVTKIGHYIWRRSQVTGERLPDILLSHVWAKTEDEALKIANEHRMELIATGKW